MWKPRRSQSCEALKQIFFMFTCCNNPLALKKSKKKKAAPLQDIQKQVAPRGQKQLGLGAPRTKIKSAPTTPKTKHPNTR
jgi:hypothetical protein